MNGPTVKQPPNAEAVGSEQIPRPTPSVEPTTANNNDPKANPENGSLQPEKDAEQQFTAGNPFCAANISNVRDVNITYQAHQAREDTADKHEFGSQEVRLAAASRPMPISNPNFNHNAEDLSQWVSELRTRRLLFLLSYDDSSLYSAAQEMASELTDYYQPFVLSPVNTSISVDPCLPAVEGDPAAVFVADAKSSTSLLDSAMKIGLIQDNLHQSNWLLIFLANDEILGWTEDPERKQAEYAHIPCIRIPFLVPRLRRAFPSDWKEIYDEISYQRGSELWARDERKFYNDILSYLSRDLLRQEVEKRRQASSLAAPLPQVEKVQAEQLLSPATPIENTVLFIATFFPDLHMREFERLLLSLLGDSSVPSTTPYLTAGGEQSVEENRLLREVWNEKYPEILAKCHLQTRLLTEIRSSGSSLMSVLDFADPESRDHLRSTFLGVHTHLFLGLLRLVRETRLIFDEEQQVADAAVRFMAETAVLYPREFASSGLGGLVHTSEDTAQASPLRLYACLRAFLQRPVLRDLVTRFLQERFLTRSYIELLELVWLLRNVPNFEALFWFKRLLDEGDEDARRKARTKLYRAVQSGESVEILKGISRWLPQGDSHNLSPSAEFSVTCFVDLNEEILFDSRLHRPRNPLLIASSRDVEYGAAELEVRWLFHPVVATVFMKRTSSHFRRWVNSWLIPVQLRSAVFDRHFEDRFFHELEHHWEKARSDSAVTDPQDLEKLLFPSLVLADWTIELLMEDSLHVEARTLFNQILDVLVKVCAPQKLRILGILWSAIEESLLDLLVFVEQLDPWLFDLNRETVARLREDLRTRRHCAKQLRLDAQARSRAARTPKTH